MAQRGKGACAQGQEFDSWDPHNGRRKPTPERCPVATVCVLWHMHGPLCTIILYNFKMFCMVIIIIFVFKCTWVLSTLEKQRLKNILFETGFFF